MEKKKKNLRGTLMGGYCFLYYRLETFSHTHRVIRLKLFVNLSLFSFLVKVGPMGILTWHLLSICTLFKGSVGLASVPYAR